MRVKRMSVLRIVCREHDREDDDDDDDDDREDDDDDDDREDDEDDDREDRDDDRERSPSRNGIMHTVGSSHHESPAAPSTHWPPG